MISLAEARRLIAEHIAARDAVAMPLAEARGHILADDVKADALYPSGDRAMMDGYALAADAPPGSFRVVGEVQAGQVPSLALRDGEAMRIYTGALLPEGAGRVVMQEEARRDGDTVTIERIPERRFVRTAGSEARPGDIVLPAGTRLGPPELAILAQVGAVLPRVVRAPMIRHLATGGELVAPLVTPQPGQIRDTNSTLLAALVAEAGAILAESHRGLDDPAALTERARPPCDLLLLSGGASVGDYDFGAKTLRRLGFTIHFERVNLRPGKPLTFATRGDRAAFVVPGNPVSHFVCFHTAIRLALERMAGAAPAWDFLRLELRGGEPLRPDPRETYWPAHAFVEDGHHLVTPRRWSTSGDTFSLAGTNALIRLGETLPPDGRVQTLLLDVKPATLRSHPSTHPGRVPFPPTPGIRQQETT
jgi:molybdopterin molybdotransferase